MTSSIHPTAYIGPQAKLGTGCIIGPFAVIEGGAKLGDGCQVGAHAIVHAQVQLGRNNILHPHAVLGGLPQDVSFKPETPSLLVCGDGNVFREGFTAHRASQPDAKTLIGSGCYFMANSHVAHDCSIGDNTIFANNVAIGGFVEIGHNVFMGGAVVVHQFCRIGAFAMVQGTTGLNMDVIPFMLVGGRPARHYKLNTVGLRRAGITGARYAALSQAFRLLRKRQHIDLLDATEEITYLRQWLNVKSKRGLHGFIDVAVEA